MQIVLACRPTSPGWNCESGDTWVRTCFFSMTLDMWACSAAFIAEKSMSVSLLFLFEAS